MLQGAQEAKAIRWDLNNLSSPLFQPDMEEIPVHILITKK